MFVGFVGAGRPQVGGRGGRFSPPPPPPWVNTHHGRAGSKQGTHYTRKTGKMVKKKSLSGKTQGILKFCQNTGNLVCSCCKFPDSKGKRYFDICHKNLPKNVNA